MYRDMNERGALLTYYIIESGYAGVNKSGTIVDRRIYTDAVPIPGGGISVAPSPKEVPSGESAPFTYRDLRDKLNTATDEQLADKVLLWYPEGGALIESLSPLEDDYVNPSEEGLCPVADVDLSEYPEDDQPDMTVVLKKGSLILWAEDGPFYAKL